MMWFFPHVRHKQGRGKFPVTNPCPTQQHRSQTCIVRPKCGARVGLTTAGHNTMGHRGSHKYEGQGPDQSFLHQTLEMTLTDTDCIA